MRRWLCFGIGFICLSFSFSSDLYAGSYFTKEEALKMAFPEATRIEKKTAIILDEQKEKIKSLARVKRVSRTFTYYQGIKEGKSIGYAAIENAWAKLSYITFMVVVDTEGKVEMVEVLVYRELRGVEIRQRWFLEQFAGKTVRSRLKLNADVEAVSGATISSRALANGVREVLAYLSVLLQLEANGPPPLAK